LIGRMKLTL